DGCGAGASHGDRRGRPPTLRRHAYPANGRDRTRAGHQDRKQGPAEPPHIACFRGAGMTEGRGYAHPEALVSTSWLAEHLSAPDLRVVDATWHFSGQGRNARAEYEAKHIPGAVFFDIDEIADETSSLPHMLPSPEKFSVRARRLGLGDGNRIIVYDSH